MPERYTTDWRAHLALAQKGDVQAQRDLGCAYWHGEHGLPKNDHLSRHWYTMAAERGHAEAMYDVSTMYLNGEGGPADVPRALAYLRRAASQRRWDVGADSAARLLADIYERGHCGVTPDPGQATHWKTVEAELERKYRGWRRRHS